MNKTISGGELSHLNLAIQLTLIRSTDKPMLLFYEIDGGLSGEIAESMDAMLQALGHYR